MNTNNSIYGKIGILTAITLFVLSIISCSHPQHGTTRVDSGHNDQTDIARDLRQQEKNTANAHKPNDVEEIKKWLRQNFNRVKYEEITTKDHGPLSIVYKNVEFNSFLIPSTTKKLYIFLNTGGHKTRFSRISWAPKYDGVLLYVDDPSKKLYKKEYLWYFGDKNNDYTLYLAKIIEKIASIYGITNKNILLLGSSNAGFCAIKIANIITGAKVIALNAQFDAPLWIKQYADYDDYVRFGYFNPENRSRLTLHETFNTTSKYMLFYNISSPRDRIQCEKLCAYLNIQFPNESGLYRKNNIYISILKTKGASPHTLFPDRDACKIYEQTLANGSTQTSPATFLQIANQLELQYMATQKR